MYRDLCWGNFITQATPTNFHKFYKRKILCSSEDVINYKEVTALERTALEQFDSEWKEPPQSFIDMWNNECSFGGIADYFGKYNSDTGYFELNEIVDII